MADSNNDGVISFPEFFFFITILQLPLGLVAQEFIKADTKEGRKMTQEQFSKALTRLRKKTVMG